MIKRGEIIPVLAPYRIIKKLNKWYKMLKIEQYRKKMGILNRNKELLYRVNNKLLEYEGLVEEAHIPHP